MGKTDNEIKRLVIIILFWKVVLLCKFCHVSWRMAFARSTPAQCRMQLVALNHKETRHYSPERKKRSSRKVVSPRGVYDAGLRKLRAFFPAPDTVSLKAQRRSAVRVIGYIYAHRRSLYSIGKATLTRLKSSVGPRRRDSAGGSVAADVDSGA
ncbi:uncharacterized protein LOC124413960 [Diprion similis]|uniref:uncharacterized protein LOC124413960 n=1 Tax=Diprion similis TaxID=362088 RepID=UPI001EF77438|nr:uncharacterized protein LOC124413960 [Diprion similis]